jgi:hypothetical protein
MAREAEALGVPPPGELFERDDARSRSAAKRMAQRFLRETVDPAINERETSWLDTESRKYPLRGVGLAADLSDQPLPAASIRAWAQLRLQNQLTIKGNGPLRATTCPACKHDLNPTWHHLVVDCLALRATVANFILGTPWAALHPLAVAERLSSPVHSDDIVLTVKLCAALRSAVAARCLTDAVFL